MSHKRVCTCCGCNPCLSTGWCTSVRPFGFPRTATPCAAGFCEYLASATCHELTGRIIRSSNDPSALGLGTFGFSVSTPVTITDPFLGPVGSVGTCQVGSGSSEGAGVSGNVYVGGVNPTMEAGYQNTSRTIPVPSFSRGYVPLSLTIPRHGFVQFITSSWTGFPWFNFPRFYVFFGLEPGVYPAPGWTVSLTVQNGAGWSTSGTEGTITLGPVLCGFRKQVEGEGWARANTFNDGTYTSTETFEIDSFRVSVDLQPSCLAFGVSSDASPARSSGRRVVRAAADTGDIEAAAQQMLRGKFGKAGGGCCG